MKICCYLGFRVYSRLFDVSLWLFMVDLGLYNWDLSRVYLGWGYFTFSVVFVLSGFTVCCGFGSTDEITAKYGD